MAYVIWVLVLMPYLMIFIKEIMHDIAPVELEDIDVTIKLVIGTPLNLLGLLEMLKTCVERLNTLLIFLFSVSHNMIFVPLFLVDLSCILLVLRLIVKECCHCWYRWYVS